MCPEAHNLARLGIGEGGPPLGSGLGARWRMRIEQLDAARICMLKAAGLYPMCEVHQGSSMRQHSRRTQANQDGSGEPEGTRAVQAGSTETVNGEENLECAPGFTSRTKTQSISGPAHTSCVLRSPEPTCLSPRRGQK